MAVLANGQIGVLYEIGDTGGIVFDRVSLDWLKTAWPGPPGDRGHRLAEALGAPRPAAVSRVLDPHVASGGIVGAVEDHWTVGRVAGLAGVSVRTLHHYDEIGLVRPSARTAAGYRAYSARDVQRLREVLAYRRLGFGLREIAALVGDPSTDAVAHLRRCAACCWSGAIVLTPWWRPSTGSWRHGRRD
ncbi:MerR family transcriptional regulator [Nonomuraea thailandensis]